MGDLERPWTRVRNLAASKVKAAPRRKCAVSGSGMAERAARVRWKPSIGTKVAGGGEEGSLDFARELMRSVMICENAVLPVDVSILFEVIKVVNLPEPGIPATPITKDVSHAPRILIK